MPDGSTDAPIDILIAIREDISSFRISFEGRLDRLEQNIRKCQREATATFVIMWRLSAISTSASARLKGD
jgi:hypothetical protein